MATVVAVTDRAAFRRPTDNVVVVDPAAGRLEWVPRDLWCRSLLDRVNVAFARGGHAALIGALREHGLPVDHAVCIRRDAVERTLDPLAVTVPVEEELRLWYPRHPHALMKDGRVLVEFRPPEETLSGVRIHQWLGARNGVDRELNDLDRIRRQQVMVARLLEVGFDFRAAVADPAAVALSDPGALDDLAEVRAGWELRTFGPVRRARVAGLQVLVAAERRPPGPFQRMRARRMGRARRSAAARDERRRRAEQERRGPAASRPHV